MRTCASSWPIWTPMHSRTWGAFLLALAISLTACGNEEEPAPDVQTSPCVEAFQALAEVPIGDDTSTADRATLTACASYDEWVAAAIEVPEATGFTEDGIRNPSNQGIAIQVSCGADANRETPVCSDAAEQGILP